MKQRTKFLIVIISEFVLVVGILLLIFFAGDKPYSITFDVNGGTLVSGKLMQEVDDLNDTAYPVIEKEGYTFVNWDVVKFADKKAVLKAVWEYQITEGLVYSIIEGSNYCTVKSCYKELYGDVNIGEYFNGLKVLGIEAEAFKDCKYIENVYLSDGIINIGKRAFEGCTSLKSVTLSNTVRKIENDAFKDCVNLETVNLCDSLITIESGAFSNCTSLSEIVIPLSVAEIGYGAFDTSDLIINVYFKSDETPSDWVEGWIASTHTINYEYGE